jgi:hypothetical protein
MEADPRQGVVVETRRRVRGKFKTKLSCCQSGNEVEGSWGSLD